MQEPALRIRSTRRYLVRPTRSLPWIALGVLALGGCGDLATAPVRSIEVDLAMDHVEDPDTTLFLHGTDVLLPGGPKIGFTAVRHKDGRVTGVAVNPHSVKGEIVELVPPAPLYDHWCANALIVNDPALEGFNFLFYVRDIGDGKTTYDEVGTFGGFGASCISQPEPGPAGGQFQSLVDGDFKSRIRVK